MVSDPNALTDDRTARARIRDAAIECFAEYGVSGTTARKVAATAGVSPGLVVHHFGSMEGLRAACDEHVAVMIRREKQAAMSAGPAGFDLSSALRHSKIQAISGYLAQVLIDDAPAVAKLVDDLVEDAESYLQEGVEAGVLQPTTDPRGRAAVLTVWSLGALVLHHHVKRLFGVDPTDPQVGADPAIASYLGPGYEIMGGGIFTEAFAAHLRDAIAGIGNPEQQVASIPQPGTESRS